MKKLSILLIIILCVALLWGCSNQKQDAQIIATTLPVYTFTSTLCQGTDLSVNRLITEEVSCLHDYTLQVSQMRALENADVVILSGAGLEEFLDDALCHSTVTIDASENISLLCSEDSHDHDDGHKHTHDPHIWLNPQNAKIMAENICDRLSQLYPQHADTFSKNLTSLQKDLDDLQTYGEKTLANLSYTNLVTFHDGFSYFADAYSLNILHSIEEESGSEASASEIIHIIEIIKKNNIPAIFTEKAKSAAADIIAAETGVGIYTLDMGMTEGNYFNAMYHNIDTIKEALG